MRNNILTLTDSYKVFHYNMYPNDCERVYSYFESRKGAEFSETVFFGLQYLLKGYLQGQVVTKEKIIWAEQLINEHLGKNIFNRSGWEYILEKYNGRLPIRIKAVAEGSVIPVDNVLMTVENTDDNCYWLTNYLETLLTHVWSSSTVATLSREVKKVCSKFLNLTSDNKVGLDFMLHDFGFRGVSSCESAGIQGAGHLVNSNGTDTIAAIETIIDYYNAGVCVFSVPATEHSVMTSQGPTGEKNILEDLLDKYPNGILSIVIDSFDYRNFILNLAGSHEIKNKILSRDGKLVFRPDSGDPIAVTIECLDLIGHVFGTQVNSKGYKVLNSKVGLLWGDGIDYWGIFNILVAMEENRWSAENIVFGMGGGLLQKVNRDTQRFAFKCSAQKRSGKWVDIMKNPLDISKASKGGRLALIKVNGSHGNKYLTTNNISDPNNLLKTVFKNGEILIDQSFHTIRKNARI